MKKMNKMEFANELKNRIEKQLEGTTVTVKEVLKVNMKKTGLVISKNDNICPTFYIDDHFRSYENGTSLDEISCSLLDLMKRGFDTPELLKSLTEDPINLNIKKDRIFFTLVNTEQNRELLETVPHRGFEDLSIVYRWNVGGDGDGLYTNIINHDLAKSIGTTEEELYELAKENTKTMFPVTIQNMNEVIADMMFPGTPIDDEMRAEFEATVAEVPDERAMYVISNKAKIFGATSMLYEEKLHDLAEKLNSNLYILPSSVHECIAISDKCGPVEELAAMVYEINMDQVDIEDRLSNQVYLYDRDERKLSVATDTPNKRLDGTIIANSDSPNKPEFGMTLQV